MAPTARVLLLLVQHVVVPWSIQEDHVVLLGIGSKGVSVRCVSILSIEVFDGDGHGKHLTKRSDVEHVALFPNTFYFLGAELFDARVLDEERCILFLVRTQPGGNAVAEVTHNAVTARWMDEGLDQGILVLYTPFSAYYIP